MRRRSAMLVGACVVSSALVVAGCGSSQGSGGASPAPTSTRSAPDPATLSVGVTHTQYTADATTVTPAVSRARTVLSDDTAYQNVMIMGWGAPNPEPSPGVYDWSVLDRRIALIRSTGGVPVITLCGAPDWMKGGEPGQTNWANLEVAPTAAHYGDFAALATTIAKRYPGVLHFQVWNELKGFYDDALQRWNYEAYTALYNKVYDALKATNSAIQVGGPYIVMQSWSTAQAAAQRASSVHGAWGVADDRSLDVIRYWNAHKHGADFVSIDGSSIAIDKDLVTDEVSQNAKFQAITTWVHQITKLPVWWSEFYITTRSGASAQEAAAVELDALVRMHQAGAQVALIWQPEDDPGDPQVSLWTSTRNADGGQPLPLAAGLKALDTALALPASGPSVVYPANGVAVVRGKAATFALNATGEPVNVRLGARTVPLAAWASTSVASTPTSSEISVVRP